MRIGLDIMGGDFAPVATIEGAILALKDMGAEDRIVLLGRKEVIVEELRKRGQDVSSFDIVDAREEITMEEKPLKALHEKPDSSMVKGFNMLAKGELDTFSSAGNSGAVLAASVTLLKPLPGVIRPCTAAAIPQEDGGYSLLLDVGTNPDTKPEVLVQFAIMGSLYINALKGISNPRVALMNMGTEDGKGNLQLQQAFALLKENPSVNFIGNLEPRDIFKDKADVFVTDGFVGNMLLKQIETFYRLIQKRAISDPFFDSLNYELYGGSPLLGISSPVVLGHGISSALAIRNMLFQTKRMFDFKMTEKAGEIFGRNIEKKKENG